MPPRCVPVLLLALELVSAPLPWANPPPPSGKEKWATGAQGDAKTFAHDVLAQALADNTVVIFSMTACSACDKVKAYFEDEGIPYYALELDQRADGKALQGALAAHNNGHEKMPAVYIRGQLVGGYDIGKAYKTGELGHWISST